MIINLYAIPGINSGADLRGKTVGPTARVRRSPSPPTGLARLGITTGDVQLLPIGTEGIVPGMEAGAAVTGGLSHPNSTQALRLGAHLMVPLSDVPYQNVGLIVKRADLERLARRCPRFLKVYRRAIERFLRDPAWGKEMLAAIMQTTDEC